MDNNQAKVGSKEEAVEIYTKLHGPVAKVFLEWKFSLDNTENPVTFRKLGQMLEVFNRNKMNLGLIPHIAPEINIADYRILFKEVNDFN